MLKRIGTPYAAIRDSQNTFARRDFPKTAADTTKFEELSLQLEPPANRCRSGLSQSRDAYLANTHGRRNDLRSRWCCSLCSAQTLTMARITGPVRDATGAVVTSAEVAGERGTAITDGRLCVSFL